MSAVMNTRWSFLLRVSFLLAMLFSLSACAAGQKAADDVTIRIAVLPILDALPIYVADQNGLFQNHNVKVELIPAGQAPERDQLITAGQADGMINEIVSTLFYNRDQIQIQIVRFSRVATATSPQYQILASQQSGITAPDGLKGVPIGISQGTIIEYMTDRLLREEGFSPDEIQTVAVPGISDRMNLLTSGEISAAMLPDPLSFLAEQQGAKIILDDSKHPGIGHSTLSFRKEFIDNHPEAIRGFLAAIDEAVQEINADPTQYENLLSDKQLVPQPLLGSYRIPTYPGPSVPSQDLWDDIQAWAKDKGLLSNDVSYQDSVNASFLSK
jgi:NitT/TauT family transport system substrate-binding protein